MVDALNCEIAIPDHHTGRPWRITAPWLKLCLMYGLEGNWNPNWSVAFDAYAQSRGPDKGLPSLTDFTVTLLMNSRAESRDVDRLTTWLGQEPNITDLQSIRATLLPHPGLHTLSSADLDGVGRIIGRHLWDRDIKAADGRHALHGIGMAKFFKWLSAWAPAHIPMIDSAVREALRYMRRPYDPGAGELLRRFQDILLAHFDHLTVLGQHLSQRLNGALPQPVPPVRVLDHLIWFDWWAGEHYPEFHRYIEPSRAGDYYPLTKAGQQWHRDVPETRAGYPCA